MKAPRREYDAALADFSRPGNRWQAKGRLTYWGKAAGLTADEIIADARAAGVTDRDADIRRGWADATPKGDRPQGGWRHYAPRARPKPPPTFPRYVRDLVAAGGGEATSADLLALSPFAVPTDAGAQTAAFLRACFNPADLLFIDRGDEHQRGVIRVNVRPCADWLAMLERGGAMPGDRLGYNPFTGTAGLNSKGKPSYIVKECVSRYPFALVEFDERSLKTQAAFWRGLLRTSPLAAHVAALVYSGGKSIHGLLHIGATCLADWEKATGRLRRLLCADTADAWTDAGGLMHYPWRCDPAGLDNPIQGCRLAGVRRLGDKAKVSGRLQTLLYLNPVARQPTAAKKPDAPTAPAEPRKTPCKRTDAQTANLAPEADGRAVEPLRAVHAHCAPVPPTMPPDEAPLDDVLAYFDVLESIT